MSRLVSPFESHIADAETEARSTAWAIEQFVDAGCQSFDKPEEGTCFGRVLIPMKVFDVQFIHHRPESGKIA
jgi:hypothetical protein